MRMNRVVFGVSPSPFLLAATIRKHISSSADVNEALSVTPTAKEIMSRAGMDLCKWVTDSLELRAKCIESGLEHTTETKVEMCSKSWV